jgi:hypothetical protein
MPNEIEVPATRLRCALAALVIVLVLFADVVFLGGSLAPLDYDSALLPDHAPTAPIALFPEPAGRKITDSWGDIGAAAWEFQPAIKWMAYCMRSGESPWWNPYEACGRMGPESLYDISFSPVTIVAAVFGGTASAISFTLLALYFAASFALIRSLNRYLGISFAASCTAAAAYLLSGFALCNLFTQMGQPYFLAPVLLYALLALAEKPTGLRFALAAMAQALLFTVTLFPPMVLSLIAVYSVVLVATLTQPGSSRARIRAAALPCAVAAVGLCLVAFLYLPVFEAHLHYVDIASYYSQRLTPGYSLESALSLFTPKHFWQSYRAMTAQPGWPALVMESQVCFFGIILSLVAASGLALYRSRRITAIALLSGVLVAIAVGQMYGIPPFTLIDHLPFFSFIRNEYWPALAGIPVAILLALGLDRRGKWGEVPFAFVAAIIACSFLYLLAKLQLPVFPPERTQVFLAATFFLVALTAILLCLFRFPGARYARIVLIAGVLLEGVYYMNHLRPIRTDRDLHLPETLQWVKQQSALPGGDRILNFGGSGIMPNWSGALQIPDVGAMELAISSSYQSYFDKQIGTGFFLTFYDPKNALRFTRESLSALGIRYVIVDRYFTDVIARLNGFGLKPVREDQVRLIYENPAPKPRAFLAAHQAGSVAIEEYHNTRVRIQTESSAPAKLVLMDSYHPNWKATVDGAPATVQKVDSAFRGVSLGAGKHTVQFTYRPKTLTAGIWISITALLSTLATAFLPKRYFA